MKVRFSARLFAMTCGVLAFAHGLVAQTTTQIFGPINVAKSITGVSFSNPYSFNTTTINLDCTALTNTTPVQAILSGPANDASLLVDNNIQVTANSGTPVNVCPNLSTNGGQGINTNNCFTGNYGGVAGSIVGQNTDTFLEANGGGVPEIDLGNSLPGGFNLVVPGQKNSLAIALTDEGGEVAGSTIYLTTNCALGGVSSGTVSGNPISNTDPSSQTQTFTFNSNPGGGNTPPQIVSFVYDVSKVTNPGNGSTPQTSDAPLAQSDFPTKYALNTSFATSSCLIHTGEVLTDGVTPACKLYTLECIDPNTGLKSGANCPISTELNEVVADFFDGPSFSLQNVYTPYGVFHQGIGFLMASDNWTPPSGGPCAFDADLANLPCPQNLLINFSGPGIFKSTGVLTEPNSTFVSIAGVPEDHTSVVVAGQWPDNWVNNPSPKVYFTSQAPNLSKGASVLNSSNKLVPLTTAGNYIPAPIHTISYGISSPNSVPSPGSEPISADNTVINPVVNGGCPVPTPSNPGPKVQPNFSTGPQNLQFASGPSAPLADGKYLLHYYAQDCAGTQELQFAVNPDPNNNNVPTWSTSFYTVPVNIDTKAPSLTVISSPSTVKQNKSATVSFSCSDDPSGSGVVLCGLNVYAPETKYTNADIGTLKVNLTTSSLGAKSVTLYAVDGAGNTFSKTINYTVTK